MTVRKAVVLAAGRGTRMQRLAASGARLTPEQERAASLGHKAMMPVGRPFLDYVLSGLADAGFAEVCLIVASGPSAIRDRYTIDCVPQRITLKFTEQHEANGTAHALLTTRQFADDDRFLVLNADNYYPVEALREIAHTEGSAVGAFDVGALVTLGNIPVERVRDYARLTVGADGVLLDVEEKPASGSSATNAPVSMNLWAFEPAIFEACARVPLSSRGEYELPQAVRLGIRELGLRVRAVPLHVGVLDLATRDDIASVTSRLSSVSVHI